MPRNAEVIRQWKILREIERARGAGVTIDHLAGECKVSTRTIRRDLDALQQVGFPLFDDKSFDDGRTRWHVNGQAFKGIAAGLTVSELCALYFSRTLVESLAGTPFRDDVASGFEKLAAGLTPHMRQFVDQLPRVILTKADRIRRTGELGSAPQQEIVARAIQGTLHHRQARMIYHSKSSERTREYLVHPYLLAYAQGGLYLLAYVPEYREVRTFAIERIRELSLLDDSFTPAEELPETAFPHSLGVHIGRPERVEIEFLPAAADYVRAREWHPSQQFSDAGRGALRMTLDVCLDQALESWILGFGPSAKVVSPEPLARAIEEQLQKAAARYAGQAPARADAG